MKTTIRIALCAWLAGCMNLQQTAAQTAEATDYWQGNLIENVQTEGEEGKDHFFLYNVGTGLMLYMGGNWGTQASCASQGKPLTFTLQEGTADKYGITASFKPKQSGNNVGNNLAIKDGTAFWDRALGTDRSYWKFVLVDTDRQRYALMATASKDNDNDARYLYAESNNENAYGHIMTVDRTNVPTATDELGLWKIVTRDDFIEDFKNTYTRAESPSDATFLVRAENFNNQNANVDVFWHYEAGSMNAAVGYQIGNSASNDKHFGRYYNLGLTGAHAGGIYWQEATMPQSGWYRLDCQGFYNLAGGKGSAQAPMLFAIVADKDNNYETNLNSVSAYCTSRALRYSDEPASQLPTSDQLPNNEVKAALENLGYTAITAENIGDNQLLAGIAFYPSNSNDHKGCYPNELAFCVPEAGRTVKFGIYFPEAQQAGDNLFIDDFKMKFLGEDFVITEDAMPAENNTSYDNCMLTLHASENEDNYNPATSNHTPQLRHTLILKRHFDAGVWNSLTLPIDMTRQQVINAFGAGTKLAKLHELLPPYGATIHFSNVDMGETVGDDAVVLEAGKIYLIRPTRLPLSGGYTALDKAGTVLGEKDEYYVIDRMSIGYTENEDGSYTETDRVAEPETCEATNDFGTLTFKATYNKIGVYGGSYVFSKGNLYHLKEGTRMLMKGLRGYLTVSGTDPENAAKLSFLIDGIDETTGVSGMTVKDTLTDTDAIYYRLDGTRAGRASQLGRGIYIAKGRKILVK